METPLEKLTRLSAYVELANVRAHTRRSKTGKLISVESHHRETPEKVAQELSGNTNFLSDQQLQLALDYLRINRGRMSDDQNTAAQRLIDSLEQTRKDRLNGQQPLRYSIDPLRNDETRLDWSTYRDRLRTTFGQ